MTTKRCKQLRKMHGVGYAAIYCDASARLKDELCPKKSNKCVIGQRCWQANKE